MLSGCAFCECCNHVTQCQEALIDLNPLIEMLASRTGLFGALATCVPHEFIQCCKLRCIERLRVVWSGGPVSRLAKILSYLVDGLPRVFRMPFAQPLYLEMEMELEE